MDSADDWRTRALAACNYNQSRFGAILMAALGIKPDAPPRFGPKAEVTSDRYIMCDFQGKDGALHQGAFVGSVEDIAANIHGLSKHLRLTCEEHKEFETLICTWLGVKEGEKIYD